MAETSKLIPRSSVHLKVQDGSGTPLTYTFKLIGMPTWQQTLPQQVEAVLGQQAGASVIEGVAHNGISGTGKLKARILVNDQANTTDATAAEWLRQMFRNTFSGGLSTFTSTNSLPFGGGATGLWTLTFENSGASNFDQTFAGDGFVSALPEVGVDQGAVVQDFEVDIVEEWTKTAA